MHHQGRIGHVIVSNRAQLSVAIAPAPGSPTGLVERGFRASFNPPLADTLI
jgi:hypothetical protein